MKTKNEATPIVRNKFTAQFIEQALDLAGRDGSTEFIGPELGSRFA
ncbi:MAG: hypothetical protein ACU88J_07580 [Gammaproteobacteria bacterium]